MDWFSCISVSYQLLDPNPALRSGVTALEPEPEPVLGLNPCRTPVPFWGQTTQLPSNFCPNCPQNETAVLNGLTLSAMHCTRVHLNLTIIPSKNSKRRECSVNTKHVNLFRTAVPF